MKKELSISAGAAALALLGFMSIAGFSAYAETSEIAPMSQNAEFAPPCQQGQGNHNGQRHGPSEEEIAAIESGDYEAWAALQPENSPLAEYVTADNFDTFVEMHTAMQNGDQETANALRDELGLPERPERNSQGNHNGQQRGRGNQNGQKGQGPRISPEMIAAVESGDYEAFIDALPEGSPLSSVITPSNFSKVQEMYDAFKNGDIETAQSIRAELGL